MLHVKPATVADGKLLFQNLRHEDYREVEAASGDVQQAITKSIELSSNPQAFWYDAQLLCIWGVVPVSWLKREGCPWMLATTFLLDHKFQFLRRSVREKRRILNEYDLLRQCVDSRNKVTIDWLKWLGFTIYPAQPLGRNGELFHPFEYQKNV